MKLGEKVKQHDELMGELIQMHQESSKRLRIMENVQAFAIPVLLVLGLSGLAAFLKVFGLF